MKIMLVCLRPIMKKSVVLMVVRYAHNGNTCCCNMSVMLKEEFVIHAASYTYNIIKIRIVLLRE